MSTVQALPPELRAAAVAGVRQLVAPGGGALGVQFVCFDGEPGDEGPPWLLDRAEIESFAAGDVTITALETRPHPRRPDGRPLWVVRLRRGRVLSPTSSRADW